MLSGVPGTSLWGLKARAEEHARPDRLFADPLAAQWFPYLEPFFSEALAEWYSPTLQQSIALRTTIFDRATAKHLQRSAQAVVVEMGAGFSTRFGRLQPASGQWYELDLPEVIEARLALKEPPAANHWFLADSLFASDWMDQLSQHEPSQMLFLAEGLLMYFPLERVERLFALLRQRFAGAYLAFDVLSQWQLKRAQVPGEEVESPVYWGLKRLNDGYAQFRLLPAGDLSLSGALRQDPRLGQRLTGLQRWLLKQGWLTQYLGGTLYGKLLPALDQAPLKTEA